MKKIYMIFLGLFLVLGIAACGGDATLPSGLVTTEESEQDTTLDGMLPQLEMPGGLRVNDNTKELTWDSVDDATGYKIYVDGEFEVKVTGTNYDFSLLTGDNISFSVVAVANSGMTDSNMSASIAYVANRTSVIAAMELAISNTAGSEFGIEPTDPTAFATELVNKGMTPLAFEAMMTNMGGLVTLGELTTFEDIYESIDEVIDDMDMADLEAFISSVIKTELLPMLQAQLESMENANGMYVNSMDDVAMLEAMIEFLENHADEAVRSVMVVLEYLMDIEAAISMDMISDFESLVETENLETFDSSVFVSLKDDMVDMFKDNLPSLEDVTLLNTTLLAFASAFLDDELDLSLISISKQSASQLLGAELFFNFLLAIDADYVDAFIEFGDMPDTEPGKTFAKENIDLLDEFLDDNSSLIEEMNGLYSEEEMETLFLEYMTQSIVLSTISMGGVSETEIASLETSIQLMIEDLFDFNNIMVLKNAMSDNFNDILDGIIDSDYAIIDSIFAIAELSNQSDFLAYNDDGYMGLDFNIDYYISEPGTYYIKVMGLGEYEYGDYGVTINYNGIALLADDDYLEMGGAHYYEFTITEENAGGYLEAYTAASFDSEGYLLTEEMVMGSDDTQLSETELVKALVLDLLDLLGPIVEDTSYAEYDAFLDLVLSALQIQLGSMNMMGEGNYQQDMLDAIGVVEVALKNTSEEQLNIFKSVVSLLDTSTYFEDFIDIYSESEVSDNAEYDSMILAANAVLELYDDISVDLNAFIDEAINALSDPDVMIMLDITTSDVSALETEFDNYFTELVNAAEMVKDYQGDSLTEDQIENLMTFVDLLNRNVLNQIG